MTDDKNALETALAELEELAARKGRPDRYHARAVLVSLGEKFREDPAMARTWAERTRAAVLPIAAGWEEGDVIVISGAGYFENQDQVLLVN